MGWVIMALLLLIIGWVGFYQGLVLYFMQMSSEMRIESRVGVTEYVGQYVYGVASVVMLFAVPLLSMRLISDERKQQTLPLLFSAPLSLIEIVLGKFVGLVVFLTTLVLVITAMMISLNLWSDIDFGYIIANSLGLWMMVASFAALGLFMSSLTQLPVVAGILTFVTLFALMILDKISAGDPNNVLYYFSLSHHFEPFSRGMLDTRDFAYFLLFITVFLTLTVRRLDADRLRG